jgi:hypothetical protein
MNGSDRSMRLQELQSNPNRTAEEEVELQELTDEAMKGIRERDYERLEAEKKAYDEQEKATQEERETIRKDAQKNEENKPLQTGGQTDTTPQPVGEDQRRAEERDQRKAEQQKAEEQKATEQKANQQKASEQQNAGNKGGQNSGGGQQTR